MKNRYIAPVVVTTAALTLGGCAEQQDPETLGKEMPVASLTLDESARLRETPHFYNTDNSKTMYGEEIIEIDAQGIAGLRDSNDNHLDSSSATVELSSVRSYEDWYGIPTEVIIADACETDLEVNPFDENAIDQITQSLEVCDMFKKALSGRNTVWVNSVRSTVKPIE